MTRLFKVYEHDMWFDGEGYSSNERFSMGSMTVQDTDGITDNQIMKTFRKRFPVKKGMHLHTYNNGENITYIEDDSGSIMFEIEEVTQ